MNPDTKRVGIWQFTETRTWVFTIHEQRMKVSEKMCHDLVSLW